jgi:2-succinyl-6-hydroxy-2,4-cyclohexadiene-1-carboxylate synthase
VSWLLLHGFTGTPHSFGRLALPEDCVIPARCGHLDAPLAHSFWAEVDRVAALGRACTTLLGYSLGGRLALGLLARHPQRFERALIVSAHPGLTSHAERVARREHDQHYVRLLREQGLAAFLAEWEALPLWATQQTLPTELLLRQRRERERHDPERLALSLCYQGLAEMPDLRPLLNQVRCQVRVLAGERDLKFAALARELCGRIPGARLTIAEDAGHNLLLERPELLTDQLRQGCS